MAYNFKVGEPAILCIEEDLANYYGNLVKIVVIDRKLMLFNGETQTPVKDGSCFIEQRGGTQIFFKSQGLQLIEQQGFVAWDPKFFLLREFGKFQTWSQINSPVSVPLRGFRHEREGTFL